MNRLSQSFFQNNFNEARGQVNGEENQRLVLRASLVDLS